MLFRGRWDVDMARDSRAVRVCNRDLGISATHEMGQVSTGFLDIVAAPHEAAPGLGLAPGGFFDSSSPMEDWTVFPKGVIILPNLRIGESSMVRSATS